MHSFLKNYFKILKFKPFLPRLLINFHVSQTCNSCASQTCNSCDLSVKKGEGREMRKRGLEKGGSNNAAVIFKTEPDMFHFPSYSIYSASLNIHF
ncbi:hypothetical protein FKM82_019148 [Ascaphus truei]